MTSSNNEEAPRIRTTIPYEPEKDKQRLITKHQKNKDWKARMKALRNVSK